MANTLKGKSPKPPARAVKGGTFTYEPEQIAPMDASEGKGYQADMNNTKERNFGKSDPKPGKDANKVVEEKQAMGAEKKVLRVNKRN